MASAERRPAAREAVYQSTADLLTAALVLLTFLIFDVEAHYGHSVEAVSPSAPGPRLSIGWWIADP